MDIVREAYFTLMKEDLKYSSSIKYSGRFKDYNAYIRKYYDTIEFNLSKKWKTVDKEIVMGLLQSLMVKLFKKKTTTINIDLYNNFIKHLHLSIPKNNINPYLKQSFDRVNDQYFFGMMEHSNLTWGSDSRRKLASYDYKTDTISVSTIFKQAEPPLLDYVMYHEMLHKKHKFKAGKQRNRFHSSIFKRDEKAFNNAQLMENRITQLIRGKQRKTSFLAALFR
jgi:hypothetical protein